MDRRNALKNLGVAAGALLLTETMKGSEETVDQRKIEAAFSKLQANPEILKPVENALNNFFAKLNLGLNKQEKLALLGGVFARQGGFSGAREMALVSGFAAQMPANEHCTPKLISYQCSNCQPNKPAQCKAKPDPVPPPPHPKQSAA
jgi:hypothetical protein